MDWFLYYFHRMTNGALRIITIGDPLLRKLSQPVADFDGEVKEFIQDLFHALEAGRGVGLAAVQVGSLSRIFVTHVSRDRSRVFINPQILETSIDQEPFEEGCLSIPGLNADVIRPTSVRIQAWNEKGRPFSLTADGMLARVIQHEMDHLDGTLFVDRLSQAIRDRLMASYSSRS
jgi:peptide deformylase